VKRRARLKRRSQRTLQIGGVEHRAGLRALRVRTLEYVTIHVGLLSLWWWDALQLFVRCRRASRHAKTRGLVEAEKQ